MSAEAARLAEPALRRIRITRVVTETTVADVTLPTERFGQLERAAEVHEGPTVGGLLRDWLSQASAPDVRTADQIRYDVLPDPVSPEQLGQLIDRAEEADDVEDMTTLPCFRAIDAAVKLLAQHGVTVPRAARAAEAGDQR